MKNKKFLSLDWFKNTVEKSAKKAINKKVGKIVEQLMEDDAPKTKDIKEIKVKYTEEPGVKLYNKLHMVGRNLTVVLPDGVILTKSDASSDDFYAVKAAQSLEEIIDLMGAPEVVRIRHEEEKNVKKMKALQKGINILTDSGEFVEKDGSVFLKGISRTIPQLLVEKFIEVVADAYEYNEGETITEQLANHEEFQSLKRFFMWCCLNPRAEVANDLYGFLERNSFRITKQGFFVALRNVVTVNKAENNELVSFISNSYNKIKAVWKKNPDNYIVHHGDSGYFLMGLPIGGHDYTKDKSYVGKLKDLYLNLPNMEENRFTDAHTRTFDIRVGQLVNMPPEECNWNTDDCGHAGLHFTSDQIHYVGCGDTSVLILINPMKVVGIGQYKGRCYEYLPIMTVPREEATSILHDGAFDTLQLDEQYAIKELEDLDEKAQTGFVIETTKHQFNLPAISLIEIQSIAASLSTMKNELEKRVVTIE